MPLLQDQCTVAQSNILEQLAAAYDLVSIGCASIQLRNAAVIEFGATRVAARRQAAAESRQCLFRKEEKDIQANRTFSGQTRLLA